VEVRTIPIVFLSVGDPVGSGFVSNEARPNGNLTGFANWEMSMIGKWLELFKEVAPKVERVGLMVHPETAAAATLLRKGSVKDAIGLSRNQSTMAQGYCSRGRRAGETVQPAGQ
jgi:putative ABC transport system substrate-binding protein